MTLNSKDNTADAVAVVCSEKSEKSQNRHDVVSFSEALEKTGFGLFNYLLIFLGGVMFTSNLYETASVAFILPIAECDLQMTDKDKGLLSAVGHIGIIVSLHLWGFLSDTKGRRAVLMPTLLLSSAVSILSSLSYRFWVLIVLRFVNGFFISAAATVFVYIGEFHVDRTRTAALMAASLVFAIGAMLMPVMAWAVIGPSWSISLPFLGIVYKPWRLFILLCGSPGLFSGLVMILFPESPKFLLSKGRKDEALEVLRKMYSWNIRSGDDFQVYQITAEKDDIQSQNENDPQLTEASLLAAFLHRVMNQTIPLFRKSLLLPTVLVCTIQFWMYVTIYGIFSWYPIITDIMVSSMSHNSRNTSSICDAVNAKHLQPKDVDHGCSEKLEDRTFVYSFMMEFFFGLGFVVICLLVRKVQKNHILFFILLTFGACGVSTSLVNDPTLALTVFNMFFLAGVGIQVLSGITIELYPTHLRAMAVCISLLFGRLGGVAGANITGLLLATNCEMTFYIAGAGMMSSAFLTLLLPKTGKDKPEET